MPKRLKPVRQRDLIERLAEVLIRSRVTIPEALEQVHVALIRAALADAGGSQKIAAERQKIHRNTLRHQMIALGMLRGPSHPAEHTTAKPPGAETSPPPLGPAPGSPYSQEEPC